MMRRWEVLSLIYIAGSLGAIVTAAFQTGTRSTDSLLIAIWMVLMSHWCDRRASNEA